MKKTIELDWEQVDQIVIDELKQHLELIQADLSRRIQGQIGGIFEHDFDLDKKIAKKHIKAFKLILSYYGIKDE